MVNMVTVKWAIPYLIQIKLAFDKVVDVDSPQIDTGTCTNLVLKGLAA